MSLRHHTTQECCSGTPAWSALAVWLLTQSIIVDCVPTEPEWVLAPRKERLPRGIVVVWCLSAQCSVLSTDNVGR